jgi:HAD superfamily hydrolase (TIGR01549 family)
LFLSKEELQARGGEIEKYRSDLYQRKYLPHARAFPMVRDLFARIRAAGQSAALASSCKKDELQIYKRLAQIEDLVTAEATADDADKSKPHPDIFAAVMKKLAPITVNEAIVCGDSPYDAEAARKIGLRAIGLLCGGFPEAQLRATGCVAIFSDPADLLHHYESSPAAPGGQR